MREILFRGKRLDNGEWVEGVALQHDKDKCSILFQHPADGSLAGYEVDPKTVGQYTGLTDKNGKKVFEGDIVKMHYFFQNYDPGTLGAFEDEEVLDVVISINLYGVDFETLDHKTSGYLCYYLEEPEEELEVFGNKWDNPELLEAS